MPHFFLKLYLCLLAVVLSIVCLIFLLANHYDGLARYVPGDAQTYFHCEYRDFLDLKTDWQFVFIDYIAKNSSMDYRDWRSVLETEPKEIAIFSINGQFFIVAPESKKLNSLVNEEKLSHTKTGKALIFPEIRINQKDKIETWIEKTAPVINFSPFLALTRDLNKFSWPLAVEPDDSLLITGKLKGSKLDLKVKTSRELPIATGISSRLFAKIPNDTRVYLHNIDKSFFSYEAENTPDNLKYLLLKSLNVAEFYDNREKFALVLNSSKETPASVEDTLSKTLARMYPSEQTKELPDKTEAIHLIATPEDWQFKDENSRRLIAMPETDISLELIQDNDKLILTSNMTKGDLLVLKNLTYEDSRISLCNLASQQNSIYVNPSLLGIKDINNLLIEQKSATNFDVCID